MHKILSGVQRLEEVLELNKQDLLDAGMTLTQAVLIHSMAMDNNSGEAWLSRSSSSQQDGSGTHNARRDVQMKD